MNGELVERAVLLIIDAALSALLAKDTDQILGCFVRRYYVT